MGARCQRLFEWAVVATVLAMASEGRAEPPPATPPPAAIPAAIAARLPPGGFLVASRNDSTNGTYGSDDWFVVTRVDARGATELTREIMRPDAMSWLDSRTLVTVATKGDDTLVRRYVDGVLDESATVAVPFSAWALPPGKTREDVDTPILWIGKAGAVGLARCHTFTTIRTRSFGTSGMSVCTRSGSTWLRVDGGLVATMRAPRDIRTGALTGFRSATYGGALPRAIRAPAGYTVKLRKVSIDLDEPAPVTVKGFSCTGPGGASSLWPDREVMDGDTVRATKVRWLTATPAIFAVDFKAADIHGEHYDSTSVFQACQPHAFDDFVWLGDGRWADLQEQGRQAGEAWTFHVDDVVLGTVAASATSTLIAPVP